MYESHDLRALERDIEHDFATLNLPTTNWVPATVGDDGAPMLDVLVVGGGMCGLVAAFHLRRAGIQNIRVVDAQPAGLEGPWRTFARMKTLRSPKHLTGPASGIPNLTFRRWYEAQFGGAAWATLGYIPREMWADYLGWFGRITAAGVENGARLMALEELESEAGPAWRAQLSFGDKGIEAVCARLVVLATGREGLAVPRIPEIFAEFRGEGVDHTGDAPTRTKMKGRDVIVVGLGASAFDYAAEALEGGAQSVRILGRAPQLSRINKAKQIGYAGFLNGFPLLSETERADIFNYIFSRGVAPPRGTVQRVMRHDNIELTLGASINRAQRLANGRLSLETAKGRFEADRVVLGTGYRIDIEAPEYLAGLSRHIRRWRQALPEPDAYGELQAFPYLGNGFQFLPATQAAPAALQHLLCFNHAAMLSLGNLANDIPAVSEGGDRLVRHIAARLYLLDKEKHALNLRAYEEPELVGDEISGFSKWWPEVC